MEYQSTVWWIKTCWMLTQKLWVGYNLYQITFRNMSYSTILISANPVEHHKVHEISVWYVNVLFLLIDSNRENRFTSVFEVTASLLFLQRIGSSPPRNVSKAVSRTCSVKKVFFKISQYSQENTCLGVSFNTVAVMIKRDSSIGVFLWILPNF